jgi:hypothetical protein
VWFATFFATQVSLYHHTWTGARGAMLDYVELPKSVGTTSLLTSQHTIWFDAGGGWRGGLVIQRKGISTFAYECVVGGQVIPEVVSGARGGAGGLGTNGGGVAADEPTFAVAVSVLSASHLPSSNS